MKRIPKIVCLFFFLFIFQSIIYGQENWINFKADAVLSFTIDVPTEMEFETKEISTAIGKLSTQTYSLKGSSEDPNYLYLINIVEYPIGTFPSDSLELMDEYIINSINSTVEKVDGELIYSSAIEGGQNGYGRLYRIKHNNDQLVIKGKSYIKKDAFLNIQVFTTKDKSLNNEMNYFLDSFKAKF